MTATTALPIAVLCGGVGAARFLSGLVRVVDPARVTAIVNVGDDAVFHGLHVSPDLDTVLYTLAGMVDETTGWGVRADTSHVQEALARLGRDTWFRLGDADLATHIHRTALLREGLPLSGVTERLRRAFGIGATLLPATDDTQATMVRTDDGWLAFQDYFVRRGSRDVVREVRFDSNTRPAPGMLAAGVRFDSDTHPPPGVLAAEVRFDSGARPAPGVLVAIAEAEVVIVAPSNPIVSIGPVLAVEGVRTALVATAATIVAVSPIVGGQALKGPAAAMLASLGHEVSAAGVAALYADFLDVLVIDEQDADLAPRVTALGVRPVVAPTIMRDAAAKAALARAVLDAARAHGG